MFGSGIETIDAIFMCIVIITIYLIPSVIACIRKAKRALGIFILNLFLGWTLLGWVGALVWAVSDNVDLNRSNWLVK